MTQALEATMLICFGLSWPMNLIKNIKAGTAKSMSLKFILLIVFGYIAGIGAKLINHQINYVLAVYILNIAIVSLNVGVYFINKHKDKIREKEEKPSVEEIVANEMLETISEDSETTKSTLFTSTNGIDFYEAMNR